MRTVLFSWVMLAGDTAREGTSDEVKELKAEARQLKETLAAAH